MMLSVSAIYAQPGAVQKVSKSVFSLTTFNKDGGIIASSQGVFIDNNGTAISTFKPFIGAVRATVVDAAGKTMEVDAIMGADELYDVAKFRVLAATKGAPIASRAATAGEKVWLAPYSIKKPAYQQEDVSSVEQFNESYNYYIFNCMVPDNAVGSPFVNKDGQVIGIMHYTDGAVTSLDANYARQLKVTGLSTLDAALRESNIRTALPTDEEGAMTMMALNRGHLAQADYLRYANEFIQQFPASAFGYKEKATVLVQSKDFAEADKVMTESVKKAANKAEAHYDYADIIYQKIAYMGDSTFAAWTLDKAIDESRQAYAIKAEPAYKHQEAQIRYLKGEYQQAYDLFMELTKTSLLGGELYYEAAQAKTYLQGTDDEIQVLLDSAVSVGSRTGVVAPYYLARARFLDARKQYRDALQDYNMYDSIARPTDPAFFFMRYKCESNARMWQQALLDIARACYLAPGEPTYFAEWASLDLRVKRLPEGISAATQCTKLAPEYPDGYLLLGLLQIENKQKEEGLKNLQKAKDLGDTRAEAYLEKYK